MILISTAPRRNASRRTIEAGQASNGTVPRLDGSVYMGLYCAFCQRSTGSCRKRTVGHGRYPNLCSECDFDPATPFQQGKTVFENLADGYHISVEGGRHSIYGFGEACPDDYITDFLVDGAVSIRREDRLRMGSCHHPPV